MIQREINNKTNEDRSRSALNPRSATYPRRYQRLIRVKRIIRDRTPVILAGLCLLCLLGLSYSYGSRPPRKHSLTKSPLLWAKLDGSLTDEVSSGSSFAYSPGKPSTASGISLKEGDNIQYGPGAEIDAASDVYENWNPNQGTMNVWVQPDWTGNDNQSHWIWSADSGRIDTADANLKAYWKFDEGSEKFASDSSSSDNIGYLHGPALSFDGGDYANIPYNASFDIGVGDFTVLAWVKMPDATPALDSTIAAVNKTGNNRWDMFINTSGQIDFYIEDSSGAAGTNDGTALSDDKWQHIGVVFDRDGNASRYLNGSNTGTNDSISARSGDLNDGSTGVSIGQRNTGAYFTGVIDDVRIYSRALSATEVAQHYAGTFANESGLVGYWKMDENQGQTVADSSGNNNNGTLGATSGSSTDDPAWVNYAPRWTDAGRFGEALIFDGSDDEVELGDINF